MFWIALVLAAGTVPVSAQTPAQAEKALESARHKDVVDGDLKGAIDQYRKIAKQFGKQPEVAAQALYHLGQCQEKLGQFEARQSYEQIVREYPTASLYAGMARSRLAALSGAPAGETRSRLLWDKAHDLFGSTTADGRFYCYPDRESRGLGIRDLARHESRRVTDGTIHSKVSGFVEWCAMAPDGKRIAFTWVFTDKSVPDQDKWELRSIGIDGKDERTLFQPKDSGYLLPGSWSPDRKWIATRVCSSNREHKVVLVSTDGAPARTLLTLQNVTAPNGAATISFSPDGKWLSFHFRESGTIRLYVLPSDGSARAATEIASDPTLTTMGWTLDGKGLLFTKQFAGQPSLHLQPVTDGKPVGDSRAVSTPSPLGDYLLGMTPQGALLHGYFKQSTVGVTMALDSDGTLGAIRRTMPITTFGPALIAGGIRYSPDGKCLLYTTTSNRLVVRSLSDGSEITVTPQLEGRAQVEWAADSKSVLVFGAAKAGNIGVIRVDLPSGAATFLSPLTGSQAFVVAPDGETIYFVRRSGSNPVLARNLKTGSERTVLADTKSTFDLKLSRDGKSLALVADETLRILDISSGRVQALYPSADPPTSTGVRFGGGDWSPDGQRFFAFVALDNFSRTEMWRFPVNGGPPIQQRMAERYRGVRVSPDGSELAAIRFEFTQQVLALENFLPPPK